MMRCTFFLALAVLAGVMRTGAAEAEIVRVWTSHRTAESFESMGELFGRGETTGGRTVARSQPAQRDGFYFLTRVRAPQALAAAQARIEVVLPGSEQSRVFSFPVALKAGDTVLDLGVTGADWPGEKVRPVAWRVMILDADGHPWAEQRSFLWSGS